MKKKLILVVPIILAVAGGAYKFVLGKPAAPPDKMKLEGTIVSLEPEFLVNLDRGRYAKVSIALVLDESEFAGEAEGTAGESPKLHQDGAVRAVITDHLTGATPKTLLARAERAELVETIEKHLVKKTDEPIHGALITDLTVQ